MATGLLVKGWIVAVSSNARVVSTESGKLNEKYRFRHARSAADIQRLKAHFSQVFFDGLGVFVETLFHRFPRMKQEHGFIAEERETGEVVAAFILMPWTWQMEGVRLNIAQMAGAATRKAYRRRGLIGELIRLFDQTLAEEQFDLAVINGIRGFYRQFGFCFAIPVENHIDLPRELIPGPPVNGAYTFRLARKEDIPYLMREDEVHRNSYFVTSARGETTWEFLLDERHYSIFGSEFWLMERGREERYYCRMPLQGHFGRRGLIVSEVSEDIPHQALGNLFAFCKQKAMEAQKPYVRLNLHDMSRAAKAATAMGAQTNGQSAWQIKMPQPARFLMKIAPLLESRLKASGLVHFSGTLRLDFFKTNLDMRWEQGRLLSMAPGQGRQAHKLRIYADLFPILCLGHRSWSELAHIQPDIGPSSQESAALIEALFPVRRSWLYEPA